MVRIYTTRSSFPAEGGNFDAAIENLCGALAMNKIKNIFLIIFPALASIGFLAGGLQGLLVTILVLLFAAGSYLAFLMSSKFSGFDEIYFSFDNMRSFLESSWKDSQLAELREAMPAVPINDFIRTDYSLFAAFSRYFADGSTDVSEEDRLLINYGTSTVRVDGAIRGFSYKFEYEADEGGKRETERCYAVHKEYLQETLLRYYLEKYRKAFFLFQREALWTRYLKPNRLAWRTLARENQEIAGGFTERAESWAKEQYQDYLATGDRSRLPLDIRSQDAAFRQELYEFINRYRLIIDKDEVERKLAKEISQSREDLESCLRYLASFRKGQTF
jgi:hypothetical protein